MTVIGDPQFTTRTIVRLSVKEVAGGWLQICHVGSPTTTSSLLSPALFTSGAGIQKGAKLAVTLEYGSGSPALLLQVNTEVSEWKAIGIDATTLAGPFDSVVSDCVGNSANWSICLWGFGWIYSPDYYPSGESLFVPEASFNIGAYSNPTLTAAVKITTFGTATLANFSNLAATDLPDLYQPNGTNVSAGSGIGEVAKTLKSKIGFTPNPLENFMPEYYSFK